VTRYAVALVGRPTRFSIEKARRQLGWAPHVRAEDGIRRTLVWMRKTEKVTGSLSAQMDAVHLPA
jgi:nucleoside-diphosphate-sugar epimerase